jgi:hypothetical protein
MMPGQGRGTSQQLLLPPLLLLLLPLLQGMQHEAMQQPQRNSRPATDQHAGMCMAGACWPSCVSCKHVHTLLPHLSSLLVRL